MLPEQFVGRRVHLKADLDTLFEEVQVWLFGSHESDNANIPVSFLTEQKRLGVKAPKLISQLYVHV